MSGGFTDQTLAEKLLKLNSTQASIESLSHWCIFHRKRATQIVQVWGKNVETADKGKTVALLFLANDVLQNSRRKGVEFLNEFGKILPSVLQQCYKRDESLKSVIHRLIKIWEERKVFGAQEKPLHKLLLEGNSSIRYLSISQSEKAAEMTEKTVEKVGKVAEQVEAAAEKEEKPSAEIQPDTGQASSPPPQNKQIPFPGPLQKIASAYSALQDSQSEEETSLRKLNAVFLEIQSIESKIQNTFSTGPVTNSKLPEELQAKKDLLRSLLSQVESYEKKRSILVTLLKNALKTQESKLERVRLQMKLGREKLETMAGLAEKVAVVDLAGPPTVNSVDPEEMKRRKAAELAAKLASSPTSAAMLSSVLSTLVAEGKISTLQQVTPDKRKRQDEAVEAEKFHSFHQSEEWITSGSGPLSVPIPQMGRSLDSTFIDDSSGNPHNEGIVPFHRPGYGHPPRPPGHWQ